MFQTESSRRCSSNCFRAPPALPTIRAPPMVYSVSSESELKVRRSNTSPSMNACSPKLPAIFPLQPIHLREHRHPDPNPGYNPPVESYRHHAPLRARNSPGRAVLLASAATDRCPVDPTRYSAHPEYKERQTNPPQSAWRAGYVVH